MTRKNDPSAQRRGSRKPPQDRPLRGSPSPGRAKEAALRAPAAQEDHPRRTRGSAQAPFQSGFATLVGHTNVGKSTLLNQLVGEKIAIVADAAQTTRTRITGVVTRPHGQIVFVDTPGFHRPLHRMNRRMLDIAAASIGGVDLLLWVVDATLGFGPGDLRVARLIQERRGRAPLFLILNKIDRMRKPALLPLIDRGAKELRASEVYPVSARTGENCDALLEGALRALPEGPRLFPDDTLTDQSERALASEIIREKILHHTREEIPHATAIVIDRWEDGADGITRIDAVVLVEREGQKGIVIGAEGAMLKRVGTEARVEIERLLDRRVGLKLWVRVRDHWRDDERTLRTLGLS